MALKRINGDLSAWKRSLPRDTSGIDSTHPKYSYAYRMGKNGREDFGTYYHESQYGEFEENAPFQNGRLRAQNEITRKLSALNVRIENRDKAAIQGYEAALMGKSTSSCPYPENSFQKREWDDGFNDGQKEVAKRFRDERAKETGIK